MICPHCDKQIKYEITGKARKRTLELKRANLSYREIESLLRKEGHKISTSSIGRIVRSVDGTFN